MKFLGTDAAQFNHFHFICEGCKCEGDLGVAADQQQVPCPENCGALYIQWHNPITNKPDLQCVVAPVFEDPNDPRCSRGYDMRG